MKSALLFAGQGAHRKGMAAAVTQTRGSKAWETWTAADHWARDAHGFSLAVAVQDDPARVTLRRGDGTCGGQTLFRSAAMNGYQNPSTATDGAAPTVAATPVPQLWTKSKEIVQDSGVMALTFITQPAMLAFQLAACEHMQETLLGADERQVGAGATALSPLFDAFDVECVAGHSLGEFTALTAAGLFKSREHALELVFQRGQIMVDCIAQVSSGKKDAVIFPMYACNPKRAGLEEHEFFGLVQLVSRAMSTSAHRLLEVVNYNIASEQIVVAGDEAALNVLGRCMDPQFRGACAAIGADTFDGVVQEAVKGMLEDHLLGFSTQAVVNAPDRKPYVAGSKHRARRFAIMRARDITQDGNWTLTEEQLAHLSNRGTGRSGLKKKSWFMPLDLTVPFHSSVLRRGVDRLYPLISEALVDASTIDATLWSSSSSVAPTQHDGVDASNVKDESGKAAVTDKVKFVCNLTGTTFDAAPNSEFRSLAAEAVSTLNLGEFDHVGRSQAAVIPELLRCCKVGSSKELLAAVLTAQLCKTVQWVDVMDTLVVDEKVESCVEVTPTPTVTEMIRKTFAAAASVAATTPSKGDNASSTARQDDSSGAKKSNDTKPQVTVPELFVAPRDVKHVESVLAGGQRPERPGGVPEPNLRARIREPRKMTRRARGERDKQPWQL